MSLFNNVKSKKGANKVPVIPTDYESGMNDINSQYRRDIAPLLFGIGTQLPALMQTTPTLQELPYGKVSTPTVFSPIQPMRSAIQQQVGYGASLANRLKELGDSGLTTARALLSGITDSANKSNLEIASKEAEFLNRRSEADAQAQTLESANKAEADLKRIDAQMKINASTSAERSKALSQIFKTVQMLNMYKGASDKNKWDLGMNTLRTTNNY